MRRSRRRRRHGRLGLAAAAAVLIILQGSAAAAPVGRFSSAYGFRGHAGLYPYGMDFNEHSGQVMVADIWNHSVKRFTTGGAPAAGAVITGKGFGLPNNRIEPFDIEADPRNGDVYVANEAYSRVDHYRADGTWVKSIGMGGRYGQGCGGGRVHWPTNITVHPGNGRLYVSDGYCGLVSVYDAGFNHLSSVTFDLSSLGVGKATVRGIDVDAQGNIWLAEHKTRTLMKFGPNGGRPLTSTRVDRMNDPRGIAVDRSGGAADTDFPVYVVGAFYNEVHKFRSNGSSLGYVTKYDRAGSTTSDPVFDAIRYVTVDRSGNVYVGDTWKYVVYKMSPTWTRQSWSTAPQPPPNGGFNQMSGIGLDPGSGLDSQKLFVADFLEQRVQWFDTHNGTTPRSCSAGDCSSWLGQLGSRKPNMANSPGISYPRAMTVADGYVWIDGGNSLVVYDTGGTWRWRYGKFGSGPGEFKGGPTGIRVRNNRVYTTDSANCRIQVTDYRGSTTYAHMGSCGTGTNQMSLPQQIDVDPGKDLAYVADGAAGRNRIHVWKMGSKAMRSFSATVDGKGLNRPRGLVLDAARQWLYVSDSSNRRIIRIRLGADGYPTATAELVAGTGLSQPRALEFGPRDGRLYVSDFSQRVYAYTIPR